MTCRKGHDLHPNPQGLPHDSCIGICHWLYSASLFDILNTLNLMSHKGQVAELLELWFIPDRKLSTDLCPTQSEQLLSLVSVSEKRIYGNVASQFQKRAMKSFAFFFFFPCEKGYKISNITCTLGVLSQPIPNQWTPRNFIEVADPDTILGFLHSFYIHCLTKVSSVTCFFLSYGGSVR